MLFAAKPSNSDTALVGAASAAMPFAANPSKSDTTLVGAASAAMPFAANPSNSIAHECDPASFRTGRYNRPVRLTLR
jgi:hypothetical protein